MKAASAKCRAPGQPSHANSGRTAQGMALIEALVASAVLGQGAMAGEVVPDRQTRFRLVIGPLSLDGYLRLTPNGSPTGKDLPALIELVRSFIGFEYVWEVELLINAAAAPAAQLGDDTQLGWSSWIGRDRPLQVQAAVSGMLYEPEMYGVSGARA